MRHLLLDTDSDEGKQKVTFTTSSKTDISFLGQNI